MDYSAVVKFARLFGLFVILQWAVACSTHPYAGGYGPTPAERQLVGLIEKRLAYAYDVAWFKYPRGLPIQDIEREAAILQTLTEKGRALSLSPTRVEIFFSSQMKASREFQNEIMQAWNRGAAQPGSQSVDLAKEIRPRLDAINQEMLQLLANREVRPSPELVNYAYGMLRAHEYSPNVAYTATQSLRE